MEQRQKLRIIDEIKRIERELYLKKSQLAAADAQEYGAISSVLAKGLDAKEWKKAFSELIQKIGLLSDGGNSVEDTKTERQR